MSALSEALAWAAAGRGVFPLKPGDKTPATAHGFKDATTDETAIRGWAGQPGRNYGLATGGGLIVLDVDEPDDLEVGLIDCSLPATLTVSTGAAPGRRHLYFSAPEWVTSSRGRLPTGLDVRGQGGYVVGAGSTHPSGRVYAYADRAVPIADAPEFLLDLLRKPTMAPPPPAVTRPVRPPIRADAGAQEALRRAVDRMAAAQPDTRHDTLRDAAYHLGGFEHRGLELAHVVAALTPAAAARMGDERAGEIDRTIRQCYAAGALQPVLSRPNPTFARRKPALLAPLDAVKTKRRRLGVGNPRPAIRPR